MDVRIAELGNIYARLANPCWKPEEGESCGCATWLHRIKELAIPQCNQLTAVAVRSGIRISCPSSRWSGSFKSGLSLRISSNKTSSKCPT
jgi:hypothetical protein